MAGFTWARISSLSRSQTRSITSKMAGGKYMKAEIVRKKGKNIINDAVYNKGLGYSRSERDRLELRGLVPPVQQNLDEQKRIIMEEYEKGWAVRAAMNPSDEIIASGVKPDNIRKWKVLQSVQDRNETMYYSILMQHFKEMAPIIYTPTVGWACKNFSHVYRRPRGMFFSLEDRGEMASMVYNWESNDVDAVVVTDGSRVLGLGDLGIGGLGISIGKLDLYVAAGGFHPKRVMPCVIDVGTNNPALLNDPAYLGLKIPRLDGEDYYQLIDEFMAAIKLRWPRALIQFEDFQSKHAIELLKRYKSEYLMFNDDIQGTAATVLAGLYGALKVQGLQPQDLRNKKILICGAGSAASGVALTIRNAIIFQEGSTLNKEEASQRFLITDKNGLITKKRVGLEQQEDTFYELSTFARHETDMEGASILQVVQTFKPDVLIGLTAQSGIFTKEIMSTMNKNCPHPPIIFPLSNPTSRSECTAEAAQIATNGRAIFASGSPFEDVNYNGMRIASSQCNNRFIFPGLALGAALGQTKKVTNSMINKAAEALVELLSVDDLETRATFPDNYPIREVSLHLACRVIEQAISEDIKIGNKEAFEKYNEGGSPALKEYIRSKMWNPVYRPLVYLTPGKGE